MLLPEEACIAFCAEGSSARSRRAARERSELSRAAQISKQLLLA